MYKIKFGKTHLPSSNHRGPQWFDDILENILTTFKNILESE